jgi:hypothetical protein
MNFSKIGVCQIKEIKKLADISIYVLHNGDQMYVYPQISKIVLVKNFK